VEMHPHLRGDMLAMQADGEQESLLC